MTAPAPSVDDYFDCPEPRGRARIRYRHCLARQVELDGRRWLIRGQPKHAHPHSALECEAGRKVLAMFRRAEA